MLLERNPAACAICVAFVRAPLSLTRRRQWTCILLSHPAGPSTMSLTWLFGPSKVQAETSAAPTPSQTVSECPVDHSTRSRWLQSQKAGKQAEAARHPFIPGNSVSMPNTSSSKAKAALSSERETSTIPRFLAASAVNPQDTAAASSVTEASSSSSKWVYPSPSQFFTALQRKDRNPKQEDMDTVVTIHNAVNERTWQEVMKWEREAGEEGTAQLVTFKGRPNDRSPRAWWKVLIGSVESFGQHRKPPLTFLNLATNHLSTAMTG